MQKKNNSSPISSAADVGLKLVFKIWDDWSLSFASGKEMKSEPVVFLKHETNCTFLSEKELGLVRNLLVII